MSIYGETEQSSPFSSDRLVMELGDKHVTFLVKQAEGNVKAFELFEFDRENDEWHEVLNGLRVHSVLLEKSYTDTLVYFNFSESVITPMAKFSATGAEAYINAVHGEASGHIVKCDHINTAPGMVNVYRISKELNEMLNGNFANISTRHTYSKLLETILDENKTKEEAFIKMQVYYHHMIVAVIKEGKLQLINSFNYQNAEDILYHILHIAEQLGLPSSTKLEVSGIIDENSPQYIYLQQSFSNICFEDDTLQPLFSGHLNEYPVHYFSPFLQLLS